MRSAEEVIHWVRGLTTLGIKPGLKRMEWMLAQLGHPQERLTSVHIGGTNGKGSTLSILRFVLQEAGYKVGSFTSPYIVRFQERIQMNGKDIPDEDLVIVANKVKPLAKALADTEWGPPTEFEVLTTMAMLYFAKQAASESDGGLDIVLWEVGLGGRLDSTNVISPVLSIITNVGHDHTHILGENLRDIAYEKAGIIKDGVPVVTGCKSGEALDVIQAQASSRNADIYVFGDYFSISKRESQPVAKKVSPGHLARPKRGLTGEATSPTGGNSCKQTGENSCEQMELNGHAQDPVQCFSYGSPSVHYADLCIRLAGEHQVKNAAVAISALEVLRRYGHVEWTEEHLRNGLLKTRWLGRLETVLRHPLTVVDGAHNPQGMQALARAMEQYEQKRVTVFFCGMKDKNFVDMLQPLRGRIDRLIITEFDFPRAAKAVNVYEEVYDTVQHWPLDVQVQPDWKQAYHDLADTADEDTFILFTGSLYFISEVRRYLLKSPK